MTNLEMKGNGGKNLQEGNTEFQCEEIKQGRPSEDLRGDLKDGLGDNSNGLDDITKDANDYKQTNRYIESHNRDPQVIGVSEIGSDHTDCSKPNQDCFSARIIRRTPVDLGDSEVAVIMTVADGHGAEIHDRSNIGSKIATSTAIDVMTEEVERMSKLGIRLTSEDFYASVGIGLTHEIVRRWVENVYIDCDRNGLKRSLIRYGCTMISALYYKGDLFVIGIGDGNCVVEYRKNANDAIENLATNESLIAVGFWEQASQITDSLCNAYFDKGEDGSPCGWVDGWESCVKLAYVPNVIRAMLTTDGLVHEETTPQRLARVFRTISLNLKELGEQGATDKLISQINNYKKYNFTDDITITFADFRSDNGKVKGANDGFSKGGKGSQQE